ncbi:hypothetical protein E8E13_000099 [Curvularia kusanoi]|uniref:Transcription elongation factor Eaf N-terminal domain-containing protein n=1 Tax=Curvularia kusanoi TaxID=90978 RepID=A0A9P4W1M0_CURKU|nr:hypothetical protein E8E13_000099 [Curvularia kusanoi]
MASPMVDGRVEPHRKATYTLEISDQVRKEGKPGSGLSGVKYNHKPSLANGTRTANLKLADNNTYNLTLRDKHDAGNTDMFVFNGSRTAPPKSYVLLFDQTTQKATLERLDSTYTFNLATKNGTDISSEHGKIYPKKAHKDSVHDKEEGEVDLFGSDADEEANAGTSPDASNPYDFRHFLNRAQGKKDKDSGEAGYASSPDARNSHTSAAPTSSTHTPASQPARRAVEPAPKKRKAASVFASKPAAKGSAAKKASAAPTIHLERKATERAATGKSTTTAAAASKIKSAEFVQSSDDSDIDADGDVDSSAPTPRHSQSQQHTQHTQQTQQSSHANDSDSEADSGEEEASTYGDLEIEIPDAKPRSRNTHLQANNPTNNRTRSPSAGPISLASAANSVENTPRHERRRNAPEEIDFGSFDDNNDDEGGYHEDEGEEDAEDEDVDVENMDIGPPAGGRKSVSGNAAAAAAAAAAAPPAAEVDEDDPLYMEMMEELAAGGDSSEESEEE